MTGLTEAAPAKVNLYLHVLARRADGYHELDSLAVFAAAGDMLTADPDEELRLTLDGPFAGGLAADDDNLVLRAARALARAGAVTTGARLALDKRLPVASGIGGGSSDAAAALRLLSRLWKLAPAARLDKVAAKLGADVPVCLVARPARMTGIGETLAPAPRLPRCGLALVNPGTAVATAEVFRCRQGAFSTPAALPSAWESAAAMAADLAQCRNDLEGPAMVLCPPIGDVLAALRALPGCLLARMSGSGATCFGLFADPVAAKAAAGVLARPGWWVWGGGLATD